MRVRDGVRAAGCRRGRRGAGDAMAAARYRTAGRSRQPRNAAVREPGGAGRGGTVRGGRAARAEAPGRSPAPGEAVLSPWPGGAHLPQRSAKGRGTRARCASPFCVLNRDSFLERFRLLATALGAPFPLKSAGGAKCSWHFWRASAPPQGHLHRSSLSEKGQW